MVTLLIFRSQHVVKTSKCHGRFVIFNMFLNFLGQAGTRLAKSSAKSIALLADICQIYTQVGCERVGSRTLSQTCKHLICETSMVSTNLQEGGTFRCSALRSKALVNNDIVISLSDTCKKRLILSNCRNIKQHRPTNHIMFSVCEFAIMSLWCVRTIQINS